MHKPNTRPISAFEIGPDPSLLAPSDGTDW